MKKEHLQIIKEAIEAEWPGKSGYCFDNCDELNDTGKVYAELLSRRRHAFSEPGPEFRCIICGFNHAYEQCPKCSISSDYSN